MDSITALKMAPRLSHAMLMVPSVQDTVDYWTRYHHGTVTRSSKNESDGTLKGAFVVLGENSTNTQQQFALELASSRSKKWQLGNAIGYIGVSLLAPASSNVDEEDLLITAAACQDPNGIPVRRVASAPGDLLARFCLRSNASLNEIKDFYTDVLGMKVKAVDETELCLRFETDANDIQTTGVPTTLVFEAATTAVAEDMSNEQIMESSGNCFDHLAIEMDGDIETAYERIQRMDCPVFMKLTEMFGSKLFGVLDPSGYKVILYSKVAE